MMNVNLKEELIKIPIIFKMIKYNIFKDNDINFKTIKYGDNVRQYYRVYNEKQKEKPLVIFIHGGGWWHGSPKMCASIAKFFVLRGYTVMLPAYRLAPLNKYPDAINDIFTSFIKFINNEEQLYKERNIVVMGFSAGAELASNLVFNKKKHKEFGVNGNVFKSMVAFAGPLDFEKCTSAHTKNLIRNYLGSHEDFDEANPVNLINSAVDVPVLCVHGDKDNLVDVENSFSFIKHVKSYGGKGAVNIIKGKNHSNITELIMGKGEKSTKGILDFIN